MRRNATLKNILKFLKHNDVIIVSGSGLINEIPIIDRRMMCFERADMALSFSVGMSMVTEKRVFVICEDVDLLKSYNVLLQISASKRQNIFVLVLGCDRYQDFGGQYSILSGIRSLMGSTFSMGLISHNLTKLFDGSSGDIIISDVFNKLRGPMCVFFDVEPGIVKRKERDLYKLCNKDVFSNFVNDTDLGTSMFVP